MPFSSTLILMTSISDKPLWASLSPDACVVCLLWWLLQHILSRSDCCWWCCLTPKGLFHTHTLNIILDDMSCIRIVLFFLSLLCQAYFYYEAIIWNKIPVSLSMALNSLKLGTMNTWTLPSNAWHSKWTTLMMFGMSCKKSLVICSPK